jgi:hypothetical protein
MRNFLDKILEEVKMHILCKITFFRKSYDLRNNVGKYGGATESIDNHTAHGG